MTSPTETTTSSPVPKQQQPSSFWSRLQTHLVPTMDPWDVGSYSPDTWSDRPDTSVVQATASHVVTDVFDVTTKGYSADDFVTRSPAAKLINWKRGPLGTVTKAVSASPVDMARVAIELAKHGDSVTGYGESHVLLTKKREHAYLILTPWYPVPEQHRPWWGKLSNYNVFRMLPLCFPAGGGELPSTAVVPSEGIEPGVSPTAIVEHRGSAWQNNEPIGGLLALGKSSNVTATGYTEVRDETSGLLIRWCRMSTTRYHVLDGYLTWVLIYDEKKHRFMYAAMGDGQHPLPYIDQLNPVLGGAMMCTKVRTLATVLQAPSGKFLLTNTTAPKSVDELVYQLDQPLALRRRLLKLADEFAIPISEIRRDKGGVTTED